MSNQILSYGFLYGIIKSLKLRQLVANIKKEINKLHAKLNKKVIILVNFSFKLPIISCQSTRKSRKH